MTRGRWRAAGVLALSVGSLGAQAKVPEGSMTHVGKRFVFDYGAFVVKVEYQTGTTLRWEQLKGPAVGSTAIETCGSAEVRPGVRFFWWQEKDASIVTQVVDFEKGRVYTTWTSPDRKLSAFEGSVRAEP